VSNTKRYLALFYSTYSENFFFLHPKNHLALVKCIRKFFPKDDSRVRKGHADENFAIARHIAINKLKNEKTLKRGVKAKRKKAGWDEKYLLKVLTS